MVDNPVEGEIESVAGPLTCDQLVLATPLPESVAVAVKEPGEAEVIDGGLIETDGPARSATKPER